VVACTVPRLRDKDDRDTLDFDKLPDKESKAFEPRNLRQAAISKDHKNDQARDHDPA
jgi:hypothetical protein